MWIICEKDWVSDDSQELWMTFQMLWVVNQRLLIQEQIPKIKPYLAVTMIPGL